MSEQTKILDSKMGETREQPFEQLIKKLAAEYLPAILQLGKKALSELEQLAFVETIAAVENN